MVGNGWAPSGLPAGVRGVALAEDVGIPAGRNAGVPAGGRASCCSSSTTTRASRRDALARVAAQFDAEPDARRCSSCAWPRDGGARCATGCRGCASATRRGSSDVTAVWEGAVAMPRAVFDAVGGWPDEFRFVPRGRRPRLARAWTPASGSPTRATSRRCTRSTRRAPHGYSAYYGARNRVWLARRHLPLPLGALYVATFALRTLPRAALARAVRAALRGYRDGLRRPVRPRGGRCARETLWRHDPHRPARRSSSG